MSNDIVMNNNTSASVAVKVIKGEEMRRFQFNGKSFKEIKTVISELYSIPADDFVLQYEDDERDRVTLSSDAELNEAIKLHKYVLRFYVKLNNAPAAVAPVGLPHPPFHHRHHEHHHPAMEADGQAVSSPPHHHHPYHHHGGRGGRRGWGGAPPAFGPYASGPYGAHGHHGKKHHDKEEKEARKADKKRCKKHRKESSSSSSSSSEEDVYKIQKKQMRFQMKAAKEQIKNNWAATRDANPAQWSENRKLMQAEIKAAKELLREQAKNLNAPVPATGEQNATTEMQA